MLTLIIFLYVITTVGGIIALKLGSSTGAPITIKNKRIRFKLNAANITGTLLYIISFVLYAYLISKYDLGYIVPLAAAFVYIALFTASFAVFKERFTVLKVVAIILILGGVALLGIEST